MFQNYSKYLYLPENVLLYGEHEGGTDKSTFLEAQFRDARFKLLCMSQRKRRPPPPPSHPGTRWGLEGNSSRGLDTKSCQRRWGIGSV